MKQKIAVLLVATLLLTTSSNYIALAESETEIQYDQGDVYAGVTLANYEILEDTQSSIEIHLESQKKLEDLERLKAFEEAQRIALNTWVSGNKGYVSTLQLNIYKEMNTDSKVLSVLYFNTKVKYATCEGHPNWVRIKLDDDTYGYAKLSKIVNENEYQTKSLPTNNSYHGFKSWMGYKAITRKSSPQYKLQQLAVTDKDGFRTVNGRYCIAIGNYFKCSIGQYVDVVLDNGTVIPCVVGDAKANQHTDSNNCYTNVTAHLCASEFIIDSSALCSQVKNAGDASNYCDEWDSEVVEVRIYSKNALK